MWSLTQEKIDELESNYNEKKIELENYKQTTIQQLWLDELDVLKNSYDKWYDNKINVINGDTVEKKKSKISKSLKVSTSNQKEEVIKKK